MTSDLVQDVLHHAFARLKWFESKHAGALRAYLRRAVENRVQDEMRRAIRRLDITRLAPGRNPYGPSRMRRRSISNSCTRRCGGVTGRVEAPEGPRSPADRRPCGTGYNYDQLAAIERLPSPDAARKALKRAVVRLSEVMPLASRR